MTAPTKAEVMAVLERMIVVERSVATGRLGASDPARRRAYVLNWLRDALSGEPFETYVAPESTDKTPLPLYALDFAND